ncbi:MAG TPA: hypothetical protein VFO16_12925 [Pseudonocardiaceae bacterium]|nr:hypothetical protein [Pseudonocardiaceae bacterium]
MSSNTGQPRRCRSHDATEWPVNPDPHAGRQLRVGHRLPGGFYASVPVTVGSRRRPQPPIGSYSAAMMIATTVVFVGLAALFLVADGWPLTLLLIGATIYQWLVWAANPQQRSQSR